MTEWRVVPGFPDYEVSEDGDVRRATASRHAPAGTIISGSINDQGYRVFALLPPRTPPFRRGIRRKAKMRRGHQLVADAFLGVRPSPKHEVAHRDGSRLNNAKSNLRWATRRENANDAVLHGTTRAGERHHRAKLTEGLVVALRQKYASGGVTRRQIAEETGVSLGGISKMLAGYSWAHVGHSAEIKTSN